MGKENSVTEVTENVEQTTEQNITQEETQEKKGRFYTDEELDKTMSDRYARGYKKAEREAKKAERKKYGRLENILKSGLGVDNLDDAEKKLEEFYTEQGVKIPAYSDIDEDDIKTLASKDAEDIISDGNDAVESELRRLSDKGTENMSKREKAMFQKLYGYHREQNERKELTRIGVDEKVLESDDYKNYVRKLNPELSAKEKYEMYEKSLPKEEVETIGSMASTSDNNTVKDYYTYEEASKFTKKDFDNNPELFKAVEKSMRKWK